MKLAYQPLYWMILFWIICIAILGGCFWRIWRQYRMLRRKLWRKYRLPMAILRDLWRYKLIPMIWPLRLLAAVILLILSAMIVWYLAGNIPCYFQRMTAAAYILMITIISGI